MTTYYSEYAELDLSVFFSDYGEINDNLPLPGGVLAWNKVSSNSSNANACRLHQTVEATIPSGNSTHQINPEPSFVFRSIIGQNMFSQNFKSPSVYANDINDPRIALVTNEILSFIYGDGKFNEEKHKIETQYTPQKIIVSKKSNGKIAGYCYCNDNNIYAFEFNDEVDLSSSSSSNSSSITISSSSLTSSKSTNKKRSSESSMTSRSTRSSGSSSTLSESSLSSLSSFDLSSSSSSSSSESSLSSTSTASSGSSSSV